MITIHYFMRDGLVCAEVLVKNEGTVHYESPSMAELNWCLVQDNVFHKAGLMEVVGPVQRYREN